MSIRFAHSATPKKGEKVSGDRVFVSEAGGEFFAAIVDALGHGERADEAARRAETALAAIPQGTPLATRFEVVHEALRHSRGAAMTALLVRGGNLSVAGIGDVSFRSVGIKVPFISTPGILGASRRPLRVAEATLAGNARLFLHSDGVSSRFAADDVAGLEVSTACDAIFRVWAGTHDDASLVVIDL